MHSQFRAVVAFLLIFPGLLHAAAQDVPAEIFNTRLPDEITIQGQKSVTALQRQIYAAEDAMFDLFNELNDDELYDIHCVWEAPLGTRILQRNCRPNFYLDTLENHAEGILALIRGEAGGTMHADNARLADRYDTLKTKMAELVDQHPQLQEALSEVNALYEEMAARQSQPHRESE